VENKKEKKKIDAAVNEGELEGFFVGKVDEE
jgi:hypothetical protein